MKKLSVASAAMAMRAVRDVRAEGDSRGPLRMCGSTAPLEELRRALLDAPGTDASAVDIFAARRLRPDDAEPLGRAAVVVYGAQVVASLDDGTRADLEVVGAVGRPLRGRPRGGRPARRRLARGRPRAGREPDVGAAVEAGQVPAPEGDAAPGGAVGQGRPAPRGPPAGASAVRRRAADRHRLAAKRLHCDRGLDPRRRPAPADGGAASPGARDRRLPRRRALARTGPSS